MNFEHGRNTVVLTDKGPVRGFKYRGVYHFYGMDYAQAERFMPPRECNPWEELKEATNYGFICPPFQPYKIGNNLKNPHRFWPESENCQNLNVWTQHLDRSSKKPVIVWFHGGGFFNGSALEQEAYDGFNLCKHEDVVMVTVNHRLNVLGYLDLSQYSKKYARSVNVGNLDLIAALKWIRRNILCFGGDPENVTIFGHSGGGCKVISLMNMPEADGLYKQAMVMSGIPGKHLTDYGRDQTAKIAKMLEILHLSKEQVAELEKMDHRMIADAFLKAHQALGGKGMPFLGPMKNEDYLGDPVFNGFSEYAKKVPMILGSVYSEFYTLPKQYLRYAMNEEEMQAAIEMELGKETSEKVIPLFQKAFPEKKLIDLLTYDCGATRGSTLEFVHRRIEDGCAPTYNYFFTPVFGINEGQTCLHSADIPFIFHNTEKVPSSDLGEATARLEANMSGRFANFARTGEPQLKNEEYWPACEQGKDHTMVFDCCCEVKDNFDAELDREMSKVKSYFVDIQ